MTKGETKMTGRDKELCENYRTWLAMNFQQGHDFSIEVMERQEANKQTIVPPCKKPKGYDLWLAKQEK